MYCWDSPLYLDNGIERQLDVKLTIRPRRRHRQSRRHLRKILLLRQNRHQMTSDRFGWKKRACFREVIPREVPLIRLVPVDRVPPS